MVLTIYIAHYLLYTKSREKSREMNDNNTKNQNIHWQVAMIDLKDQFFKNTRGIYELCDKKINWVISKNSSYHYFFGRGAFHPNLTDKKVLIIGLGAIGSQVAKTLVRGGCKNITIADYDVKEPENICRSEYNFIPPYEKIFLLSHYLSVLTLLSVLSFLHD